jgi:hypothetical protein
MPPTRVEPKPGDILFVVVLGQREAELQSHWPAIGEQTGSALFDRIRMPSRRFGAMNVLCRKPTQSAT